MGLALYKDHLQHRCHAICQIVNVTYLTKYGGNVVIDWERVAKVSGKLFLLFLEYCIKISAFAVTAVVLITNGSFGTKLGTGFASISSALRTAFSAPGKLVDTAYIINDYHTMTEAAFNARYGADAIDGVLSYFNGGITYLQEVSNTFAQQPFATFFAALISFGLLYFISLVIRFARQKGQGSYLNRMERKLGERIFSDEPKIKHERSKAHKVKKKKKSRVKSKFRTKPQPIKKNGSTSQKSTTNNNGKTKPFSPNGNSKQVNKHLQDYLNKAQGN